MTPPQIRYRSRIPRRIGHFDGSAGASPVNLLADWIVRSQAVDQKLSGWVAEGDCGWAGGAEHAREPLSAIPSG